jgi:UDP-2,3-diacylglucosamine pyrophosphatase LpxH
VALSDIHIPFQDDGFVREALAQIRARKPDAVDLVGDIADCYQLSRFDKNPLTRASFRDELQQVGEFLDAVRKAAGPKASIVYTAGNHEDRLRKYLWSRASELAGIRGLNLPELLDLKRRGITWHGYDSGYRVGPVHFHHGSKLSKISGGTARLMVETSGSSVVCGHSHRQGFFARTEWAGRTLRGYELGCLCRQDPEYVHGRPNWQPGFGFITITKDRFAVELIPLY